MTISTTSKRFGIIARPQCFRYEINLFIKRYRPHHPPLLPDISPNDNRTTNPVGLLTKNNRIHTARKYPHKITLTLGTDNGKPHRAASLHRPETPQEQTSTAKRWDGESQQHFREYAKTRSERLHQQTTKTKNAENKSTGYLKGPRGKEILLRPTECQIQPLRNEQHHRGKVEDPMTISPTNKDGGGNAQTPTWPPNIHRTSKMGGQTRGY